MKRDKPIVIRGGQAAAKSDELWVRQRHAEWLNTIRARADSLAKRFIRELRART